MATTRFRAYSAPTSQPHTTAGPSSSLPATNPSSNANSLALEQASADLTLLQQSLQRSTRITHRMGATLGQLDDRLARLEKSLVPIYKQTGRLTRVQKNIEATVRSIDGLLGHNDLVEREQALIQAGPNPDDLKPYLASLDRLVAASEALRKTDATSTAVAAAAESSATVATSRAGQSATLAQMAALIDTGAKHLVGVFTKWLRETSQVVDAGKLLVQGRAFPTLSPFYLEHALPLIAYLRSLPNPHGASSSSLISSTYASVRGAYLEESLKPAAREALEDARLDKVQQGQSPRPGSGNASTGATGSNRRRTLGRLLDALLAMLKSEHAVLTTVFLTQSSNATSSSSSSTVPLPNLQRIYASLLPPALALLTTTGTSLNTQIKKPSGPSATTTTTTSSSSSTTAALAPLAFTTFQELQERQDEFEEWVRAKAKRKENELGELSHAFRGTCLTSLPAVIEDTKAWGNRGLVGADALFSGLHAVTINVVNFMRQLADNPPLAESFLAVLGNGNWGAPARKIVTNTTDDAVLLPVYLDDVFSTLTNALEARARNLRGRSGSSAIFLLNNLSYLRQSILASSVVDVLGEGLEDTLNKRMRTAKAAYLDVWSPLVAALLDAGFAEQTGAAGAIKAGIGAVKGSGGTERRETKDRFVRFHEALEEVEQLHGQARIDENDVELRERLRSDVERMVVPTYAKFVSRHRKDNYSTKYVRLDADGLEAKIRSFFE
ncbi:hypothetical protein BMF94_1327 [Rhodotorula taiwanensis]|uniref:Exocyst complex protein EXO70 n=1 Tax=Rhodotorula taiwanensis TaxID=741276 RepID=A0A2S5BG10_9BASI|nr:hypothetical protein BMF94_1327 [Rhodotorula taiwanensis]